MKTMQFPLAKITFFFMLGLLLGFAFEPDIKFTFTVLLVIFSCLLLFKNHKNKTLYSFFVFSTSIFVGFVAQGISDVRNHKNHYSEFCINENKIHKIEISIREKLKPNNFTNRYFGIVKSIDGKASSGKILVSVYKDSTKNELIVGNRILVESQIVPHKKTNNPNQFDYGNYLKKKSVLSQVSLSKSEVKISSEIDKNLWYYAANFRERIIYNLQKNGFRKEELQVANALILGQQQEIDKDILQDYQFAGAVHILSVSGLHVGYIMLFLNFILGFLPKKNLFNWLKFIIIVVSLWAFAFVAGLSPSVIRSATMFSFLAAGLCLGRENNIFHTLVASLFFILLIEPSFIFDVGFQLSYVSLFFILWLQPLLSKLYHPKNDVFQNVWGVFTVSVAAQIGAFPLSIYYFHQFPGLFFITNMVILPCLGGIMILGIIVMILAYFDIVPLLLSIVLEKFIFTLNWFIAQIANIESFVITQIPLSKTMLFALYLVIITWILWIEKSSYKKLYVALLSVLILQLCILSNNYNIEKKQELIVFQVPKKSIIIEQQGTIVNVFIDSNAIKDVSKNQMLNNYIVSNFAQIGKQTKLSNLLFYNNKRLLILDSLAVYSSQIKPDIAIITQSPKINFERFLSVCQPKIVVADGSNYKSYIKRWQETCLKRKIPFHATAEKGYFVVK